MIIISSGNKNSSILLMAAPVNSLFINCIVKLQTDVKFTNFRFWIFSQLSHHTLWCTAFTVWQCNGSMVYFTVTILDQFLPNQIPSMLLNYLVAMQVDQVIFPCQPKKDLILFQVYLWRILLKRSTLFYLSFFQFHQNQLRAKLDRGQCHGSASSSPIKEVK